MEKRTLFQIASYLNTETEYPNVEITGVKRDNRQVVPGDLFVCIPGENFDGHDFAASAYEKGAACALISKEIDVDMPKIKVDDTILALQRIAGGYRAEFDIPVVGITGSVGKTTTKEMISCVLSEKYNTHKTQGNLNNEIGLPFTVLDLNSAHEAAVIEMGMNHFGEISRLTRVARPNIAVISTIGESHIEFLGSKEGILKAKLEILEGLPEEGVVILNGDDEYLWGVKGKIPFKTVYYGIKNPEADIFGCEKSASLDEIVFTVREIAGEEFKINVGGSHNLQNALAAIAVARELNLTAQQMKKGLDAFQNTGMRQKIMEKDGVLIINDCYNANPDSMRASLALLSKTEGRKIAVLADMLELGDASESAHLGIGKVAAESADLIFVTGNMREKVKQGAAGSVVYTFEAAEELADTLRGMLKEGDKVLVKASRGMRLERVVDILMDA